MTAPEATLVRLTTRDMDAAQRTSLARYAAEQDAEAYFGPSDLPALTLVEHTARAAGEVALGKHLGLSAEQSWNGDVLPFDLEVRTINATAPAVLAVTCLDPNGAYVLARRVSQRRLQLLGWATTRDATKTAYHHLGDNDLDTWLVPADALRPLGQLTHEWIEERLAHGLLRSQP